MEIEYSGVDESLIKWRYNTEPWHIAYITDLIAKWESDKAKENTFVKHMSTVTVRPVVNGEWIAYHDGKYHCSRCDDVAPKGYRWNYCPNCGADMKGAENDKGCSD